MSSSLPADVRLADATDVPAIRRLVNEAYRELQDLGLNFTGTYQDEAETKQRMLGADVYLLTRDQDLVASISLSVKALDEGPGQCLYINQLAVRPGQRRQGLAAYLLALAERRAVELGLARLRLDTALPATHLVELYQRRGYRVITEVQWEGKTYRSCIMEKLLQEEGR